MFTNSINYIQKNIHSTFINRITILTLLLSILYSYNTLYFQQIGKGISLYSGLFQSTVQSQIVEIVLIGVGISILMAWPYLYAYKSSVTIPAITKSEKREAILPYLRLSREEATQEGEGLVVSVKTSDQYSLIAIFSILGGSLLMSSLDFLSMYLSIELQSFALYILATLNKERLSATSAGLKYFLLGSLSSCFILLGSAIIYSYTGLTQFESINTLLSIPAQATLNFININGDINGMQSLDLASYIESAPLLASSLVNVNKAFTIGFIILIIGFLFKISAAPFYQWAPDVYDGTPTIVTVWLTIVVKLTIFVFLLSLIELTIPSSASTINTFYEAWSVTHETHMNLKPVLTLEGLEQIKNLLLISSLLSLIVGTIAGLSQIKFKRLLAFSSISHVGFLLLALGIFTQKSVDSFLFYLIQYSLTSLNIFLILLAFSYFIVLPFAQALANSSANAALRQQAKKIENDISANNKAKEVFILEDLTLTLQLQEISKSVQSLNKGNALQVEQDIVAASVAKDVGSPTDINYLVELKGQLYKNPILSISMAICLFSMAGVPPLIGFFSKQFVLFSSIENGNNFLSIVAILVSVISASYYLKLIKITFFDSYFNDGSFVSLGSLAQDRSKIAHAKLAKGKETLSLSASISNIHSYIIAILTLFILFFFLDPSILLNGTQLISLTLFNI